MKRLSIISLIVLLPFGLWGQWKNVAPFIQSNPNPRQPDHGALGVITYAAGKVWVGYTNGIWVSDDDGNTWNPVNAPVTPGDIVADIDFFDANIGLFCTGGAPSNTNLGKFFLTKDGGQTWTQVAEVNGLGFQSKFLGSPNRILLSSINAEVSFSNDGGTTFSPFAPMDNRVFQTHHIYVDPTTSTVYSLMLDPSGGRIYVSNDFGISWKRRNGVFSSDTYSLAVDPCDTNFLYVVSENAHSSSEPGSTRTSSDNGNSFVTTNKQSRQYYTGAVICTPGRILYAQTRTNDGVLRSTDHGLTWTSIGGPPGVYDSRFICAKDDNTLFAVDQTGSVWMTTNAGGNPFSGFASRTDSLFHRDTLTCGDTLTRGARRYNLACLPPAIVDYRFEGDDVSSYSVTGISSDSFSVHFHPNRAGENSATLIRTLSNGLFDTTRLFGYHVVLTPHVRMVASDHKADTIGQQIDIPITCEGLMQKETLDFVLHYDPALEYLGSVTSENIGLDVPGQQWPGRTRLHIDNAENTKLLGHARFGVYGDSLEKLLVRFDSITIANAKQPCAYTADETVNSITPIVGCGMTILSEFIRTKVVSFTIRPNPANTTLLVEATHDVSDAEIVLTDNLGRSYDGFHGKLTMSAPAKIDITAIPEGVYHISVRATGVSSTQQVVIQR